MQIVTETSFHPCEQGGDGESEASGCCSGGTVKVIHFETSIQVQRAIKCFGQVVIELSLPDTFAILLDLLPVVCQRGCGGTEPPHQSSCPRPLGQPGGGQG